MPHHEPINFAEPSRPLMSHSDNRSYDSQRQKAVCAQIRAVQRAREEITATQNDCQHDREVRNLAPVRKVFQCMDCGITRHQPFGAYQR